MKNEIFRTDFYDYYVVSFNRINARMLVIGCRGKKGAPVVYKVRDEYRNGEKANCSAMLVCPFVET